RDSTKAAVIVAAVLYFQKSTGAAVILAGLCFDKLEIVLQIGYKYLRCCALGKVPHVLRHGKFFLCAEYGIHTVDGRDFLRLQLRIAARHGDKSSGGM